MGSDRATLRCCPHQHILACTGTPRCSLQVPAAQARELLALCIKLIAESGAAAAERDAAGPSLPESSAQEQPTGTWSAALPFLLLDAVPALPGPNPDASAATAPAGASSGAWLGLACEALSFCCATGNAKLGLRLSQAFGLSMQQLQQLGMVSQVEGCLQQLLDPANASGKGGMATAVGFFAQFEVRSWCWFPAAGKACFLMLCSRCHLSACGHLSHPHLMLHLSHLKRL